MLYDPKVSVIWDIIRDFFETSGCPMDVVFYTNYELQNHGLLSGHLDIVWNSPLAWVDAQRLSGGTCRAIAMRDTDRDRVSHFIVKKEARSGQYRGVAGEDDCFWSQGFAAGLPDPGRVAGTSWACCRAGLYGAPLRCAGG